MLDFNSKLFPIAVILCANVYADCPLPLKENCNHLTFALYSPLIENNYEVLDLKDDESIIKAKFVRNEDIKFLILNRDCATEELNLTQLFIKKYIEARKVNVLFLRYTPLETENCLYETLLPSVPKIGDCAAKMVKNILNNRLDIQLTQFHVIAFDVGVHVAAYMSKHLGYLKVERLTALEPYLFMPTSGLEPILSAKSAKFVDVYHTNVGELGMETPNVHLEIYFNNGINQPGCDEDDGKCSHMRVVQYYAESIDSLTGFYGILCSHRYFGGCHLPKKLEEKHLKLIGEYAYPDNICNSYEKNILYKVTTSDKSPYARGYIQIL